ncbi:MAG: YqiA/YcfP family alpha/beta fold hydrolase [Anaerolineae bacterium]
MTNKTLIFLHGFASSDQGTKAQFLRRKCQSEPGVDFQAINFNPSPRDFEFMTVTGMINRLRQFILDRALEDVRLIGSSLGALVALNYVHQFGGVKNLLLLAPALAYRFGAARTTTPQWAETGVGPVFHYAFGRDVPLRYDFEADGKRYSEAAPPPAPIVIVHGRADDILPITNSRTYAAAYPDQVQLIEVDSDHTLNDHLDLIWQQVQAFSLEISEGKK